MVMVYAVIICLASIATLATFYVLALAVVACFANRNPWLPPGSRRHVFAVVVPAHDEERNISRTLLALRRLAYPVSCFRIVVVADNCTDATALKAEEAGAQVLKRNDPEKRGKGYALGFAFERLLKDDFDAFVVIDADTVPAPDLLDAFDRRLSAGQRVLQAVYGVANPDSTPLTYLLYLGNFMENHLFHFPKSILGLPVILRGNGMCFSAEVLRNHPWQAHSVVEDTEYGLNLLLAGEFTCFVPETAVYGEYPSSFEQLHTQRIRWASGNGSMLKSHALRLLRLGFMRGDPGLADAGWSLLVSSKPLLLLLVLLPAAIVLAVDGAAGGLFSWVCTLAIMQVAYVLLGVVLAGVSVSRLKNLMHLPHMVAHMMRYAVMGLFGYRKELWTRTKRT